MPEDPDARERSQPRRAWIRINGWIMKTPSQVAEHKSEPCSCGWEFGMSYPRSASALDRPSEAAASMMVSRALTSWRNTSNAANADLLLEIARRIADGEGFELSTLQAEDPGSRSGWPSSRRW